MTGWDDLADWPWLVVVILGLFMAFGALLVWSLLRAATYPPPASLVVALGLLTFLALAGYIASDQTELATLSATGFGALAGAVSSQFTHRDRDDDETP